MKTITENTKYAQYVYDISGIGLNSSKIIFKYASVVLRRHHHNWMVRRSVRD